MQNVEIGRTLAAAVHDLLAALIGHARNGSVAAPHLKAVFYATRRPFPETPLKPKDFETWYRVFGIEHGRSRVARTDRSLRTEDLAHLPAALRTLGLAAGTEFTQSDPLSWLGAVDRVIAKLRHPLPEEGVRFAEPVPLLPVPDPSPPDPSAIDDIARTIETKGRAVIVGSSEAHRAAVAYEIAARMDAAGYRVVQVDARSRLGFSEAAAGFETSSGYAGLCADIFTVLLDLWPERALSADDWSAPAGRLDRLLKTGVLSRGEQAFIRSAEAVMRSATRTRALRDGVARYGDAFRSPELLAAIAPAVRSLLGDTLIVIHEAAQFDAAKQIVAALCGDWDETHRTPDLCLLVTSQRWRGFAFLDEPGAGVVHHLPGPAGAINTEHGRTGHRPAGLRPDRTPVPSRTRQLRPSVRLRRFLDARTRQPGLAIALEPAPTDGGSDSQGRLIAAPLTVPLLRAGPYILRYTSSFAADTGLWLLVLENDGGKDDWFLVNALAEAHLPLDRRMPASGVHDTPLAVQPVAGTYDLYVIASAVGFDERFGIVAEAVANAPDRKLDEAMLDDLVDLFIETVETDREGAFAVARFSYSVDA